MAMGSCPGQIPMPCVPPTPMATATMVRACRYKLTTKGEIASQFRKNIFEYKHLQTQHFDYKHFDSRDKREDEEKFD